MNDGTRFVMGAVFFLAGGLHALLGNEIMSAAYSIMGTMLFASMSNL